MVNIRALLKIPILSSEGILIVCQTGHPFVPMVVLESIGDPTLRKFDGCDFSAWTLAR
jgi:hypothetical protein